MDTLIYGMMRSGTTLLCDLLTVPGRSLIFNEPSLTERWAPDKVVETHQVARAFGLEVGDKPPRREDYASLLAYFETVLMPQLRKLDRWGVKEVHFHDWRRELEAYQPNRLILSVRDLRDIALSALDLVRGSSLLFPGGTRLRDEAWLVSRLVFDTRQILEMRDRPHFLIRYEDLTRDPAVRRALADYMGLAELGTGSLSRQTAVSGSRRRELEKHGRDPSPKSVGRHATGPADPAHALASYIHACLPEYSEAFGYPAPNKPIRGVWNGNDGLTFAKVQDWQWPGPEGFDPAFALRRARIEAVRHIRQPTSVMDIGCILPALRRMLPEGSKYIAVGSEAHPPAMVAADWRQGALPSVPGASLACVLGALEFVPDLPRFAAALRALEHPVLVSYHPADDAPDLDRAGYGWCNALRFDEATRLFQAQGFRIEVLRAFDGRQSLFLLKP